MGLEGSLKGTPILEDLETEHRISVATVIILIMQRPPPTSPSHLIRFPSPEREVCGHGREGVCIGLSRFPITR